MDVFGLDAIQATIVIAVVGVLLQVGLGVLQSTSPFDARKLASSAIIAVIASFTVVATALQAIPDGVDDISKFMIIVGLIAMIAGIDTLAKNGGGAVLAKIKPRKAE